MHVALIDFHLHSYSVSLANALADHCKVTLILPDKASASHIKTLREDVGYWQFQTWRTRYPTNLLSIAAILHRIKELRPQVVHQIFGSVWMNLALPLLQNTPLVTTVHDAHIHPGDRESSAIGHSLEWKFARQIIVHAESIKRQLIEDRGVNPEQLHVVPHGTYDFYKQWHNDQVQEQEHHILFFGRIWDYKGLQYLIDAEPMITARFPNARIVIAGRGDDFGHYEQRMVNRDRFIVHNYRISDQMVAQLFQEASVVVCPYIEASQSGVLAIASAFGKPVVASDVGGIPEIVEHEKTGLLVPPRDSQGLAAAIIRLLEHPSLRKEMSRCSLLQSQNEFSWTSIASRTVQVYREALALNPARYPATTQTSIA